VIKLILKDCEGWLPEKHWDKIKAFFGLVGESGAAKRGNGRAT